MRDSRHRGLGYILAASLAAVAVAMLVSPAPASAACASRLYGATGSNQVDANLYCIDPATGAATLIGPVLIGATHVSLTGLAFHPVTHVLFAVTSVGFGFSPGPPGHLLTIDPATGAATDIGSLGISGAGCGNPVGIVGDIAFAVDGTLFGFGPCGPTMTDGNLYRINVATGAATFVAVVTISGGNRRGFGLSFLPLNSPAQRLYGFPQQLTQNMYVIDAATGGVVQTIPLGGPPAGGDRINALTTDAGGGVLLGVRGNASRPSSSILVAIDPTTGVITSRGPLPDDMDALAFDPLPLSVPTLSEWGQLLMAGTLAAAAVVMMRLRRRVSA